MAQSELSKQNLSFFYYLQNILGVFFYTILAILQTIFPFLLKKKCIKNKIILITGGGSGIGQLMAIEFAKLGAIIVVWDINEVSLNKTKKLIENINGRCYCYVIDISKRENVYSTAIKVKNEVGFVYMLINNAGIVSGKFFLDIPDKQIIKCMNVNVMSHFWTLKAFLPDMIANKEGHLVSIASIGGTIGITKLVDYCTSKFAAVGLEESLRIELVTSGEKGIKSSVVCPWYIDTGMFKGVQSLIPLLKPEHVVKKILNSILADQQVIYIPRIMYILTFLKSILPTNAGKCLIFILNAHRSMNEFIGRKNE